MKVTKVTIGRLFNLGSYEHVRYEVSIELNDGDNPGKCVRDLETLVEAMNPKEPSTTQESIDRAQRNYDAMVLMDEDAFRRQHGYTFTGTREEYQNRIAKGLAEDRVKLALWQSKAQWAREQLANIGAVEVRRDAKLSWDDDPENVG